MPEFPDDPIEFRQAWSQTAGKLTATQGIRNRLQERAANFFINRKDDAAEAFREFATILDREVSFLQKELDAYVRESHERDTKIRQQQPGHPGRYQIEAK